MLLLASFAAAYVGFALLALGQVRYARSVANISHKRRPVLAGFLITLSLVFAIARDGWGFGILLFATLVTLAAVAVVATLAWRPHWLRPLLLRSAMKGHSR